eukprot:COSAG05_NODE_1498_length_4705_cov_11.449197_6_plen_36_part_00
MPLLSNRLAQFFGRSHLMDLLDCGAVRRRSIVVEP